MNSHEDSAKRSGFNLEGATELNLAEIQLRALGIGGAMDFPGSEGGESRSEFSLRTPLYIVFRHKWKILMCFAAAAIAAVAVVRIQPDRYVSEARIVLTHSDRKGMTFDPLGKGESLYESGPYGGTGLTEIGIISSASIAEEVVSRLGADYVLNLAAAGPVAGQAAQEREASFLESAPQFLKGRIASLGHEAIADLNLQQGHVDLPRLAAYKIQHNLEVGVPSNSDIMTIGYTDMDPEHAQNILKALVNVYIDEHVEIYKSQIPPDYFLTKAAEWKQKFNVKEAELQKLSKELGFASFDDETARLTARLAQIQDQLASLDVAEQGNGAKKAKLKEMMGSQSTAEGIPLPAVIDPSITKLQDKLVDLQLQKAQMLVDRTDKAPEVIALEAQIEKAQSLIADALKKPVAGEPAGDTELRRPIDAGTMTAAAQYQQLELEIQANRSMRGKLNEQLGTAQSKLETLRNNAQRVENLQMEMKGLEDQYLQYLKSNQITEISQKLDQDKISNLSVSQPPTLPSESTKNRRKMWAILIFGSLGGLAAGIGLAFLLETLDQSIKTADDVEKKLNLPHLASIPLSKRIAPRMGDSPI